MTKFDNVRERFSRGKAAMGAALVSASAFPMVVLAQEAPTTATELAQSVDISEASGAVFILFGLLLGLGVSLWVGRLIVNKFRPRA